MRSRALVLVLLTAVGLNGCRPFRHGWHGAVVDRGGVKVVSNEGTGLDDGKIREEIHPLWTVNGAPRPGVPGFGTLTWAEPDPAGNLFVLDRSDQRVTRLAPDGQVTAQFAGRGEKPGGLSKTSRFAFVDGRLYFANLGNERIEVLGPSGEVFPPIALHEVRVPGEIYYANNRFYVERRFATKGYFVYAYDRDWKLDRGLLQATPATDRMDPLRSHNTVCMAPDGIWVVYMLLNRIQKVGFDGRLLLETSRDLDWKFPKDAKGRVIPEILVHRACAVDPSGNLYVVYSNPANWKQGNDVYKFGPDGRLREKVFTLPIFNATFLRFDGQGNLFYSDGATLTKARIERREAS